MTKKKSPAVSIAHTKTYCFGSKASRQVRRSTKKSAEFKFKAQQQLYTMVAAIAVSSSSRVALIAVVGKTLKGRACPAKNKPPSPPPS